MAAPTDNALTKAFAVADAIHALGRNYFLTLVATDAGEWAATFDTIEDGDWYEDYCITDGDYPHSARSTNLATAIMGAAVKLIEDLNLNIPV